MGKPWNNESAEKWGMRPPCAPEGARSEREGVRRTTPEVVRASVRRPDTSSSAAQVLREQEVVRGYAELQSKHRATYGDDEEAREAAGKAALLRAKESLSTGWAVRLGCEQRGRLAAAVGCSASSVACASEFKPLYRRESAVREREPRERGQGFRVPVCGCAGIAIIGVYAASSDQRNCHIGQSLLASPDQRRNN
jgi:hypothetical protein